MADKDKEEAVVEQPPSAVARSLPAIPKNRASQPQGTSSSSEEDDDDEEEADPQPVDHPVPAQRESEEGSESSDSSDSDDEYGGSPNKDAVPDEIARSAQKRAKAPAQHRGEEDGDPSDKALQPKKANEPSAELAKSPQKRAKAPEQHRGEEDGDPSDMTPQPKKTKAPSAELAMSRQKRVKAPAHHRGEVDGDPSDKAPQPKKTNVPSAELAKSPSPKKKKNKKAPAQQLGEEEVQTPDSSNSEPGETAPHRDPLPKRNVLHNHRPAAPKRMKEAPPKHKSKRVRRTWAPDDEARILEALAEHRHEHGHPPLRCNNVFFDSLAERLENKSWRHSEIKDKVNSLRRRYLSNSYPNTDSGQHLYNLSIAVWGHMPTTAAAGDENGGKNQRDFDEMCELYPHLAQEVKVLAVAQPTVKTTFPRLDDSTARVMEAKLEKVSWAKVKMQVQIEIKVQVPTAKVRKELVNLLMEMR